MPLTSDVQCYCFQEEMLVTLEYCQFECPVISRCDQASDLYSQLSELRNGTDD